MRLIPAQKLTASQYARIVAETPIDKMGQDFAQEYGQFLAQNRATPDNFRALADEIFLIRLRLAQKHNTFFAKQLGEGAWERRLAGLSDKKYWSFGIKGHPRADAIHKVFTESQILNYPISKEQVNLEMFGFGFEHRWTEVTVIRFPVKINKTWLTDFKIYIIDKETYFISHANNTSVPEIWQHMETLWNRIFAAGIPYQERLKTLVEWEWFWYWTNPYGRAGASIGATLSVLLQEQLIKDHADLILETDFHTTDLLALRHSLTDYSRKRTQQILSRSSP